MANIILIASGDLIARYSRMLLEKLQDPHAFTIVNFCMEEAVQYAKTQLPDDTDLIIARGNTARMLKAARLPIPVVTIPFADAELIRSIEKAKELYGSSDSQIAYIGIEDTIRSVIRFLNILHREIKLYHVESSTDIKRCVLKAKQEKVAVIIGGIYTKQLAEEQGLNCVLLESSLESVREAYERALELQKGVNLQKRKFQEKLTLLKTISEGIISINEKGKVTIFNAAAESFFQVAGKQVLGKSYMPLFQETEKAIINRLLIDSKEVTGHEVHIHSLPFLFDFKPIMTGQKNRGVIISIQPEASTMTETGVSSGSVPSITSHKQMVPTESRPSAFLHLIGSEPSFQTAIQIARSCGQGDFPLILTGEEGTGKESVARCIHEAGKHSGKLFLAREASLLTFNDFLSANNGTLYIRHLEMISPAMSNLITDLLDNHSAENSGGLRINLNIRIIAGSGINLTKVLNPRLYYTLHTFLIPLPALRQRPDDILPLFQAFMGEGTQVNDDIAALLKAYSWPGNIRQLKNLCTRFSFLCQNGQALTAQFVHDNLDDAIYYTHLSGETDALPLSNILKAVPLSQEGFVINGKRITYEELQSLCNHYQGKKSVLARKLGISRSTLWRYLKLAEEVSQSGDNGFGSAAVSRGLAPPTENKLSL